MLDVLVVGAGPAGNHAALHLARMGHRVAVVERRHTIGDKLCSGVVGAECLQRFPPVRAEVYRAARRALLHAPSGKTVALARQEPQAYVLDRVAYVAGFAEQARAAGAQYLLGHAVHSLTVDADGVTAHVANGAGPYPMRARSVIVATGFGSRITRSLGLGQVRDYLIGAQAEVLAPDVGEIEVYVGHRFAPGSFGWLVPTTEGHALAGVMVRKNATRCVADLLQHLKETGRIVRVIRPARRWGVPVRPLGRTSTYRVLVAGDAAGQVKPITGGGIYYGLISGELAAETLGQSLRAGDLSGAALSAYDRAWNALLGDDLRVAYAARRLFERIDDSRIEFLVKTIAAANGSAPIWESRGIAFDWHGRAIRTLLQLPLVERALLTAGVLVPKVLRQ